MFSIGKPPRLILAVILLTVVASGFLGYFGVRAMIGATNEQLVKNNPIHQTVTFHRISRGQLSGYDRSANLIINNRVDWLRAWDQTFCHTLIPCPATPEVDFSQRTVLAVFLGQRGSTGYEVKVIRATMDDSKTTVDLTLTVPGRSCITGATMTYPYDMVDIPRTNGPVSFTIQTQTFNC